MKVSAMAALALLACSTSVSAAERFITLASTTSTQGSGLFEAMLPVFEARTGIEVRVVAVGTGQALRLAARGDADVLLVHDRASEERFVAEGWGVGRVEVMFNDFLIAGPRSDPAGIAGGRDAAAALARIASLRAPFLSRGDDSGTHKAELRLWRAAEVDPLLESGRWYRETGSGMGATLNTAVAMAAYTLVDRGTWLSFRNRGDLAIAVEGDSRLENRYSAILVNPARHPHAKAPLGRAFIDWLTSKEGQGTIGAFRVSGEILFHPLVDGEGR